jgi:hypothetical protein
MVDVSKEKATSLSAILTYKSKTCILWIFSIAFRCLKCVLISFHYNWFYLWYEWCPLFTPANSQSDLRFYADSFQTTKGIVSNIILEIAISGPELSHTRKESCFPSSKVFFIRLCQGSWLQFVHWLEGSLLMPVYDYFGDSSIRLFLRLWIIRS